MPELISSIEQKDISPPTLTEGATTVVLQRHEAYERDPQASNAGSITNKDSYGVDLSFFEGVLDQEAEGGPQIMVLLVSSDTQYAGKGYRSIETTELVLQAASEAMNNRSIDPHERILNIHPDFATNKFGAANVRPMYRLREPQLFGKSAELYLEHLLNKYGNSESGTLSQAAWAAHEADVEKEERGKTGAEGVADIVIRTKKALSQLCLYAAKFHKTHPNTHLIIWAGSHYDTISPLVKDATHTPLSEFVPVAYGGGIVIELPHLGDQAVLKAGRRTAILQLGSRAATQT